MSLFDVLKYQNTKLDNRDSLLSLPPTIIKAYWQQVFPWEDNLVLLEACGWLAAWARSNPEKYKMLFNKVLKEYNDDI